MDEVRIWNYARDAATIAANKNKRIQRALGLVGRWGLDEGSGTAAGDSADANGDGSVNDNPGTLTNGPTWVAGAPALVGYACTAIPSPNCCAVAQHCDDADVCTDDTCDPGTNLCGHTNNSAPCNDGNACTQTDTCQAGVCTGSNPVVCTASDQCHNAGT